MVVVVFILSLQTNQLFEEELIKKSLEETNNIMQLQKLKDKIMRIIRNQYNFDAISLMPTNLYGPNDNYHPTNSHVIPSLYRKIYRCKNKQSSFCNLLDTGKPLREFLYVDDLAEACIFVLEHWNPNSNIYNSNSLDSELCWLNVGMMMK